MYIFKATEVVVVLVTPVVEDRLAVVVLVVLIVVVAVGVFRAVVVELMSAHTRSVVSVGVTTSTFVASHTATAWHALSAKN